MKIKIKIKTLILFIFVFALTIVRGIPTAILLVAGTVDHTKAPYFYEKYVSYPTSSNIRGNYKYARSLVDIQSKYTIYNNGWGGGGDTSPQDVEKAKVALQKVMEDSPKATEERDYLESYKMLLDLAIVTGDAQLLEEWADFGQDSKDESILYYANIYKGFFLHVNGNREAAMKILDKYENSDIKDVNYDILKAEILLFQGKYEEAKNLYKEISLNNSYSYEHGNFGSARYLGRDHWFEDTMDKFKGDNVISGKITHEGKPMPFVEIYLQEPDGGVMTYGNYYIAMTDKNGYFQTLGLKDGEYRLGIGIHDSRLTDRVLQASTSENIKLNGSNGQFDFVFKDILEIESPKHGEIISGEEFTVSWEGVEGADYYTIEMVNFLYPFAETGGLVNIPVLDDSGIIKYKTTSARVNMELSRGEIGGYGINDDGVISPSAFLGLFVPSLEYPITVNAYDENDNLITSSLPLKTYYDEIPSITLEGSFSEGEELIAKQDYPGAIDYYENLLISDQNNIEALRYLTKIYGIGWEDGKKDIDRALELGSRYADIGGSNRLLTNIIGLMEIDEIKEHKDLYRSSVIENKENYDDSYYYFLSRYYIATENWQAARDALKNEEGYVSSNLYYLNIYFGDYEEAAENLKHLYQARDISSESIDALNELENTQLATDEKKILDNFLLKLASGISREEGKQLYNKTIKEVSNSNIKTVLRGIYYERGWDIES